MRIVLLALASFLLPACVSLSTFQTPVPVGKGRLALGAGAVTVVPTDSSEGGGLLPELYARYGVSPNVDVTGKFLGIPPFGALYGDVKVRMVQRPFSVSGVLGVSVAGADSLSTVGFYPMVLAGSDHFYVGGKAIFFSTQVAGIIDELNATMYGVVVGGSFGGRMRFLPELNLYFGGERVVPVVGVGFQYDVSGSP
ncbi:MAG TPA: hypothetical protein VJ957_08400 [Longimicrobiales bacterium]|nr:hypothetical protein [Longimicrobiales bacterium]